MILNRSKTIRIVISQHFLLFYCDLTSCTTPACFSTFYQCVMVPTLVENSNFFGVLVLIGLQAQEESKRNNYSVFIYYYRTLRGQDQR